MNVAQLNLQKIIQASLMLLFVEYLASDGTSKHPTAIRMIIQGTSRIPPLKKPRTIAANQTIANQEDPGVTQGTGMCAGTTVPFTFAAVGYVLNP